MHRKNSLESIELMLYAPNLLSNNSQQQDQQLSTDGTNSSHCKSHRSATNNSNNNPNLQAEAVTSINNSTSKYFLFYLLRNNIPKIILNRK